MLKTTRENLRVFAGAIVVFVYWPITPLGRQLHDLRSVRERASINLRLAGDQANMLREKFRHDARFQFVQFIGTFKREDQSPCLSVSGSVLAKEDFFAITNAVESLGCPLEIIYQLENSNQLCTWSDREGKKPYILNKRNLP